MTVAYPALTEAEAAAWVTVECQVTSQPCLDTVEVLHLVRAAARPDADGVLPSATGWTPTYDLAWAAWKGWLLKAAKAVLLVDITGEGQGVRKSQVREACMAMAREAARGVLQAVQVTTAAADETVGPYTIATPGTTYGPGGRVIPDDQDLDLAPDVTYRDGLPVP